MSRRTNPYVGLPRRSFWNRTFAHVDPLTVTDWYQPKFLIRDLRVATAGSCFAQHIGRALKDHDMGWFDFEPAPEFLPPDQHSNFGFGVYSARYGNIYTPRQFLQLVQRVLGLFQPAESVWQHGNGWVDPFRPTIEPQPYDTGAAVVASRQAHFRSVLRMLRESNLFVFTLGLTEAWVDRRDGAVYPVCPGVSGGQFDDTLHQFVNFSYPALMADMQQAIALIRAQNPTARFILTVSPVPLMATATGQNVAVATSYSKSALRAVAGDLAQEHDFVDYFPSYEIISNAVMRGQFYQPDMRQVHPDGVAHVMRQFFAAHAPDLAATTPAPDRQAAWVQAQMQAAPSADAVICDEELLARYGDGE